MNTVRTAPVLHEEIAIAAKHSYSDTHNLGMARRILAPIVKQLTGKKYVTTADAPLLGQGAYGCVFSHPTMPGKVIKVCWNSPRYLDYAAYSMIHCQDNPYVPRIDSITMIRNTVPDTYFTLFGVVVMERLEGTEESRDHFAIYRRFHDDYYNREATGHIAALRDAVKSMTRWECDWHSGNVMIRGGKQAVFTDPVAG